MNDQGKGYRKIKARVFNNFQGFFKKIMQIYMYISFARFSAFLNPREYFIC